MLDLDEAIRERHSTRMFSSRPVPGELVNEALALAQLAPSNSNIQPWHVVLVSGSARISLSPPWSKRPSAGQRIFRLCPSRSAIIEANWALRSTAPIGIGREDKVQHDAAVLRNWEFFRAPLAGIVCMHRDLGPADALSVGMFLQTLLLALIERGLGRSRSSNRADAYLRRCNSSKKFKTKVK
jgi:nitroreductase